MKTRITRVTPGIALKWLERNTINRPLRPSVVEGYKTAYQRGEHILTHQGIAFSTDGDLLDGQHRLTAIAQMPQSFGVDMLIATDLEPKAFMVLDQGLKRSPSDIMGITTGHAAVARYMAAIMDTARGGISSQMLVPYVKGTAVPYDELIRFCQTCGKTWSSASVRTAAILRLLDGTDPDYVKLVYHSLNTAEFDTMPMVAQTLFRQHLNGNATNRGYDMFCRAFKVFDKRNQSANKIQISDPSAVLARAREIISERVLGNATLQKKAPTSGAKVNKANSKAVAHA